MMEKPDRRTVNTGEFKLAFTVTLVNIEVMII